jgi:Zn-finger nucleic acid-binding protein
MGDEWVCQDCNYGTDEKLNKDECPLCKGSMVNIGEVEDDLKLSNVKDSDDYEADECDTPLLDDDFAVEEEMTKKVKK